MEQCNALAVQQGTNGIYRVIIFSVRLNRPIWYSKGVREGRNKFHILLW